MISREERIFSELLLARGLVAREFIEAHAKRRSGDTSEPSLAEVLIGSGELDRGRAEETLEEARAIDQALAPDLPGGTRLGEFVLLREIGRGGMGIVYEAEQESLGRRVALKVLPAGAALDERLAIRFLREARAAARLQHPGIVPVFASGRTEGVLFFAMELIAGRSLAEVVAEGPMEPRRAARIAAEIARALDHAHQSELVHRDVKPENVLLTGDDRSRLTDFGLVHESFASSFTLPHHVLGTPAYISPEQARGDRVDRRADIYALGAVLYTMLCGKPPYGGDVPSSVLSRVLSGPPTPLLTLRPDAPPSLVAICTRAMARDLDDRYATAAALAEDLEAFGRGDEIVSVGLQARSRRRWRTLLGVAAALAAVGAMIAVLLGNKPGVPVQARGMVGSKSIFDATPAPSTYTVSPYSAELGVKFRSDTCGYVTGIRFYKDSRNDGAHVGHLWTAAGALLQTAIFSGETREGWQEASFQSPVRIAPNATYVASYQTGAGRGYNQEPFAFQQRGVDRPPLHVLQDGLDGCNGVLKDGPPRDTGGFPDRCLNGSNFFVDVTFREVDCGDNDDPSFVMVNATPGRKSRPSFSPDGKRLAYSSCTEGRCDAWMQDLVTGEIVKLSAGHFAPVFAPDGRGIAFGNGEGVDVSDFDGKSIDERSIRSFTAPVLSAFTAWCPRRAEIVFGEQDAKRSSGIWIADLLSRRARKLTTMDARSPAYSPHGQRIAFISRTVSATDLWTIRSDGSGATRLTDDQAAEWSPFWSADGHHIYFGSDRGGVSQLWAIAVDEASGSPTAKPESKLSVVFPATFEASLSADGAQLALVPEQNDGRLFRLPFDPVSETLTGPPAPLPRQPLGGVTPHLSPDQRSLVYREAQDHGRLMIVAVDGTHDPRPIVGSEFATSSPRWSPDGQRIAFQWYRSRNMELWTVRPDGSDAQRINGTSGDPANPVWSPDGARIAYSVRGRDAEVVAVRSGAAHSPPEVLPPCGAEQFDPWSWSADGETLAGSASGIVLYSLRDRRYQRLTDFGRCPVWLGDGRRLLFFGGSKIFVIDSQGGKAREIFSAAPAGLRPYLSVSADGRALYISLSATDAQIWLANLTR